MKKSILLFCVILSYSLTKAQRSENDGLEKTPLVRFFQNNFDSTVMYEHGRIDIIASTNHSTKWFLSYMHDQYKWAWGYAAPDSLIYFFLTQSAKYQKTVPDTNTYLVPKSVNYNIREQVWASLQKLDFYSIFKKEQFIMGCNGTSTKKYCDIDYDVIVSFYVITKKEIKKISFYAINFFEECCPGRTDRKIALDVKNKFEEIFK